jgi:tartronate-semialdehyde synthase
MVMRAMGADGVRVHEADEIAGAIDWALAESEARGVPVLVEVMVEREANAAMGKAIDAVVEFEPVPEAAEVAA